MIPFGDRRIVFPKGWEMRKGWREGHAHGWFVEDIVAPVFRGPKNGAMKEFVAADSIVPKRTEIALSWQPLSELWTGVFYKGDHKYRFQVKVGTILPCEFRRWAVLERGVWVKFVEEETDLGIHQVVGNLSGQMWVVAISARLLERGIFHQAELRVLQEFELLDMLPKG